MAFSSWGHITFGKYPFQLLRGNRKENRDSEGPYSDAYLLRVPILTHTCAAVCEAQLVQIHETNHA